MVGEGAKSPLESTVRYVRTAMRVRSYGPTQRWKEKEREGRAISRRVGKVEEHRSVGHIASKGDEEMTHGMGLSVIKGRRSRA